MIDEVLIFLRNHLNARMQVQMGSIRDQPTGDKVVFLEGDKMDPVTFKLGAVSTLLIKVEEERTLRAADPFARVSENGDRLQVAPDIRVNLYVLFVARFKQYEQSWAYLSWIVQYFQSRRVFDYQTAPDLADDIDRLTFELVSLDFAEQNEIWSALRTTYHPSLLYKVQLVVFRDKEMLQTPRVGEDVIRTTE